MIKLNLRRSESEKNLATIWLVRMSGKWQEVATFSDYLLADSDASKTIFFQIKTTSLKTKTKTSDAKTETLVNSSRDQDRDLDKMNLSALESRDHGLEITSLAPSIPIGDRALA